MDDADHRRGHDVDAPGIRRRSRARQPRPAPDARRHGGPAGFEKVVPNTQPIGADEPDLPAHWSVTFGVDDADAAAAKAVELGATVTVAPFDAPWSRLTVLSDPQGASFIASQFVPDNKDLGRPADTEMGAA